MYVVTENPTKRLKIQAEYIVKLFAAVTFLIIKDTEVKNTPFGIAKYFLLLLYTVINIFKYNFSCRFLKLSFTVVLIVRVISPLKYTNFLL